MKRLFTLVSILSFAAISFAQSPRIILVEHFTQASCGPCASINPRIQPILDDNHGKVVTIKYQTSWPGFDPMHNHNPNDANARVGYYGVTGVPNSVMDGVGPSSPIAAITQAAINSRGNFASPFKIDLKHALSPGFDKITATMDIEAMGSYSGNLVAHIVVVEKEIGFGSAPGSNGETVFHEVMKKMLPNSNGTDLKKDWAVGDKETIELSWELENVYNLDELNVVAFIQNEQSQVVLQAAGTDPDLSPSGPNDGLVSRVSPEGDFDLESQACGTELSPIIEVMNAGSERLTSLDIYYRVNGGAEQKYEWNGFLDYLQKGQAFLPTIAFTANAENWMDVRTENPNGESDANSNNDKLRHIFGAAPWTSTNATLEVTPAGSPAELSWKVFNSAGDEVATGGDYTAPFVTVTENISLNPDDCYRLEIDNTFPSVNGRIRLKNDSGDLRFEVKIETDGKLVQNFGTYLVTGVEEVLNTSTLSVYPNPTANASTIEFEMKEATRVDFVLMNAIGQKVWSQSKDMTTGLQQENIDVSSFANGLYFLQLRTEKGMTTQQLLIER